MEIWDYYSRFELQYKLKQLNSTVRSLDLDVATYVYPLIHPALPFLFQSTSHLLSSIQQACTRHTMISTNTCCIGYLSATTIKCNGSVLMLHRGLELLHRWLMMAYMGLDAGMHCICMPPKAGWGQCVITISSD